MTESQLKAFAAAVKASQELQDKLKSASAEEVVSIAKQAGFTIDASDFNQPPVTLSDEELEGAAGGGFAITCFNSKDGAGKAGGSAGLICIDAS